MQEENYLYWLWLSEKCGVASREFGKLISQFSEPFDIYRMEEDEIEHLEGIGSALKGRLCDKSLTSAYGIWKYCKQHGIWILPYTDPAYPERLRSIEDPPALLYVLGALPNLNRRLCIGMVGTRKMSEYGRQAGYKLSYELAAANVVVVSGMALGVDGISACGALAAGGTTIAVLGCGISVVYPEEHRTLMRAIAKQGAVVTEYPPSMPPKASNFPKRNRIISGFCQGVVIVEGTMGSGSMITAHVTVKQGRDLFALPGKITEKNASGPNELIRQGARVALCVDDVLSHYDFLYHDAINYARLEQAKRRVRPIEEAMRLYGVPMSSRSAPTVSEWRKNDDEKRPSVDSEKRGSQGQTDSSVSCETVLSVREQEHSLLATLDENTRRIFQQMPLEQATVPDALTGTGLSIGEIISCLTLLELNGLVRSLPGGMYIRK